jgi:hypothetical protein
MFEGDKPLLGLDDGELYEVIGDRLEEDDRWLFDEFVRRHIVAKFRLLTLEQSIESRTWFARLGAQS